MMEYRAKHVRSPYRFFPVTVSLLMYALRFQIEDSCTQPVTAVLGNSLGLGNASIVLQMPQDTLTLCHGVPPLR